VNGQDAAGARTFTYPHEPSRRCDIVIKGGITSGIVYPLAICRLAEHFRLQQIGGTSAGAIAAAAAAAAEYGRRERSGDNFRALEELPAWLGDAANGSEDSNLFHLFQPTKETRGLFALVVAAISHPKQTVAFELAMSAVANARLWALLGALPGLALFVLVFLTLADDGGILAAITLVAGLIGSLVLSGVGAVAAVAVSFYWAAPRALAENGFGICNGRTTNQSDGDEQQPLALTDWLHGFIARASGRAILTFGDLWGGNDEPRKLDLSMITTCLTLGRPYRLPFDTSDGFYFHQEELKRYFPDDVVQHMIEHADGSRQDELWPLPAARNLPVVFAARLSLSFPVLLSTVPLHRASVDDGNLNFLQCHFSDGGICSNFPIHFFDSALPRWPTFGVNLAGPIVDGVDVWMPDSNEGLPAGSLHVVNSLQAFAGAIRGAVQNWHDNAHIEMPAYRDRIVHIRFGEGEGGLNLNMPPGLIAALSDRGDRAGRKLAARFAGVSIPGEPPSELDWNNHRRIRQRVALSALEELALQFAVGFTGDDEIAVAPRRLIHNEPMPGEHSYRELLDNIAQHKRYADFDDDQRELASIIFALLVPLASGWSLRRGQDLQPHKSPAMDVGGPEPLMQVRIVPPL
jgi:predicted acylesterase/phospholipase RssA